MRPDLAESMEFMKPIVMFGVGKFADLIYFYFKHDSPFKVQAFTVDQAYLKETTFHGLPVTPFESLEKDFPPAEFDLFVAMGYNDLNQLRAARIRQVRAKGYKMVNYIHPRALISRDLMIGENCCFLENVLIQPFSQAGDGVVILPATNIGHNARIGDFCYISGTCCISAMVTFGPYCFVSLNTTFKPGIKVGQSAIIGAGALILSDVPDESVYIAKGTPQAPRSSKFYRKFI